MTRLCRIFIFSLMLLFLFGIAAGSNQTDNQVNKSASVDLAEVVVVPDVQSILSNPPQYYGKTVSLKAVVSKTYAGKQLFTVVDRIGCALCTTKNAKNSVTIWYVGEIPAYRDIVQITGEVVPEKNKGYHINATLVKI